MHIDYTEYRSKHEVYRSQRDRLLPYEPVLCGVPHYVLADELLRRVRVDPADPLVTNRKLPWSDYEEELCRDFFARQEKLEGKRKKCTSSSSSSCCPYWRGPGEPQSPKRSDTYACGHAYGSWSDALCQRCQRRNCPPSISSSYCESCSRDQPPFFLPDLPPPRSSSSFSSSSSCSSSA